MPNTISENNIQRFNPTNIEDLTPILVDRKFGRPEDFIEIFIMDLAGNILNHIPEYEDYIIPQTNPFGALTNEFNKALAGIYDLGAVPINTLGRMFGYNPGFSGTKLVDALTGGRFSEYTGYDPDVAYFFGPTSAKRGFTLPSMKQKE